MAKKVIKEHFFIEFRVIKLILCRIQVSLTTKGLKLAEFGGLKLKAWRILVNLGRRRLILAEFGKVLPF